MLIMTESFAHYATGAINSARIYGKWSYYQSNGGQIAAGSPLGGQCAYDSGGYMDLRSEAFTGVDTVIVGFAFKGSLTSGSTTDRRKIMGFVGSGSWLGALFLEYGSGRLVYWTSDAYGTGGNPYTSTLAILPGVWNYLEIKIKFDNSAGTIACKLNGFDAGSVTGVDTTGAGTTCDHISLGGDSNGWGSRMGCYGQYADLYIADTTGSYHNDFLGPSFVQAAFPTSDVSVASSQSAGTDAYALVDDATPDDDSTYNYMGTASDEDLLGFDAIDSVDTVLGVQITAYAREETDTDGQLDLSASSGGTTYNASPPVTMSTTYKNQWAMWETDPDTGSPWTESGVNAADFGYKRT